MSAESRGGDRVCPRCGTYGDGSYTGQVILTYPFPTPRWPVVGTKRVGIDRCLVPEIHALWNQGVETDASCCGHGLYPPTIYVPDNMVRPMRALGYWERVNAFGVLEFLSKTLANHFGPGLPLHGPIDT